MTTRKKRSTRIMQKQFTLPSEHGSWIWWIGPFLIGVTAGGKINSDLMLLFIAALTAFLFRQPTTMLVKVLSGRRSRADLGAALFWMILYGLITCIVTAILVSRGFNQLLLIAFPAIPVFVLHLWYVSQRSERGKVGIELIGSGVLALAAPAAYWVSGGGSSFEAWILWGITWLQSAASIVYVYFRLQQRRQPDMPPGSKRWQMGTRSLLYHTFNLIFGVVLAFLDLIPPGIPIAFCLMLLDVLEGILRPPVGVKPSSIGIRQLLSSTLFVMIVAISYLH